MRRNCSRRHTASTPCPLPHQLSELSIQNSNRRHTASTPCPINHQTSQYRIPAGDTPLQPPAPSTIRPLNTEFQQETHRFNPLSHQPSDLPIQNSSRRHTALNPCPITSTPCHISNSQPGPSLLAGPRKRGEQGSGAVEWHLLPNLSFLWDQPCTNASHDRYPKQRTLHTTGQWYCLKTYKNWCDCSVANTYLKVPAEMGVILCLTSHDLVGPKFKIFIMADWNFFLSKWLDSFMQTCVVW